MQNMLYVQQGKPVGVDPQSSAEAMQLWPYLKLYCAAPNSASRLLKQRLQGQLCLLYDLFGIHVLHCTAFCCVAFDSQLCLHLAWKPEPSSFALNNCQIYECTR